MIWTDGRTISVPLSFCILSSFKSIDTHNQRSHGATFDTSLRPLNHITLSSAVLR